jgi:DNA repair protein RadC
MLCKSPEKALNTADILKLLEDIANHRQEHFVVLSLDTGQRLITKRIVFIGTVNSVLAHPREVFAGAIADLAACIVVAHNHPSGNPSPSKQDIAMTQQLAAAGQILGVPLHDHIIVTRGEFFSFRAEGMLEWTS